MLKTTATTTYRLHGNDEQCPHLFSFGREEIEN